MGTNVGPDLYHKIDGQLLEIKRQLRRPGGYPYDPEQLSVDLEALIQGKFQLPTESVAMDTPATLFPIAETNVEVMIAKAEEFSRIILGVEVDIRKQFDLPAMLPWKNVLVIYDPGMSNREAVELALKGQKLEVWEEYNVMDCTQSAASTEPKLYIIENSLEPSDTEIIIGSGPANGNGTYLDLRGYTLACGQRMFIDKGHLDPDTMTRFPDSRYNGSKIACAGWNEEEAEFAIRCLQVGLAEELHKARRALLVQLKVIAST